MKSIYDNVPAKSQFCGKCTQQIRTETVQSVSLLLEMMPNEIYRRNTVHVSGGGGDTD